MAGDMVLWVTVVGGGVVRVVEIVVRSEVRMVIGGATIKSQL